MARSKSFFGLRRGSTKSHTYQIYKGEQVTKDRVYYVTNPQSEAQMKQRLKMPLVATNSSVLEGLVNHSFEGVTYGEESLKYFRSLNLAGNDLEITEYVPKGITDVGASNLLVSKGTLDTIEFVNSSTKTMDFWVPTSGDSVFKATAKLDAYADVPDYVWKYIFEALNLDDNKQLTVLLLYQGATYQFANTASTTIEGHYHRYIISRLIGDASRNNQWKIAEAFDPANEDNTSISITDGYTIISIPIDLSALDGNSAGIPCTQITVKLKSGSVLCAGTCINSQLVDGQWKRSEQRLTVNVKTTNLTFENVEYGYLNATAVAKSAKYLNTGTDGVGITGGSL